MEDQDKDYRRLLQELENKAQDEYDKTVIMLSTGALGLSFTFLKDIVNLKDAHSTYLMVGAWICWAISATSVLYSFYSSRKALHQAIEDLDNGIEHDDNHFDRFTGVLNFWSGSFFAVGLFFMIAFVNINIK
jgi:hypothetical protein